VGRGTWWTARECWKAGLETGASHILVLADDAIPCKNFCDVFLRAVATRPDCFVNLFTLEANARMFAKEPFDSGKPWIDMRMPWCSGLAMLAPRALAAEFLSWCEEHLRPECYMDEGAYTLFHGATGRKIATTNPSLVEHDVHQRTTMVNGNPVAIANAGPMTALHSYRFAGDAADSIDWTAGAVEWTHSQFTVLSCHYKRFLKPTSPVLRQFGIEWSA